MASKELLELCIQEIEQQERLADVRRAKDEKAYLDFKSALAKQKVKFQEEIVAIDAAAEEDSTDEEPVQPGQ